MTEVGGSLEEATQLRHQLETALSKLQTKQSPVEKVLSQADQVVAKQPSKSEVYSAMASNLAVAWRGLNNQLQQRLHLLEQAVAFYSRCREFSNRMDKCMEEFGVTELPNDYEQCKRILQRIIEMKKSILEASMFSMNEEQLLLELLQEVRDTNLGDSRPYHVLPGVNKTKTYIQDHLEELQERRRQLEILFIMRKTQLEARLRFLYFHRELQQLRLWLLTSGAEFLKQTDLGESAARVDMILFQNKTVWKEALEVRDQAIKLTKRIEKEDCIEMKLPSYEFLDELADFLTAFEHRQEHLEMAGAFFEKAAHAGNKLDQLEMTLKTWEPSSQEVVENMESAINDAAQEPIDYGRDVLNLAPGPEGTQGVVKKIEELERRRHELLKLIAAQKRKSTELNELFYKKFDALFKWLTDFETNLLKLSNSMGRNYAAAKAFHEQHSKALNEMQSKSVEVNALFAVVPKLAAGGGETSERIFESSDRLRLQWQDIHVAVENRLVSLNYDKLSFLSTVCLAESNLASATCPFIGSTNRSLKTCWNSRSD